MRDRAARVTRRRIVSFPEEMGKRLDDYCEEKFGDLVKVLRAPERLGLIKAKNFGARAGRFCSSRFSLECRSFQPLAMWSFFSTPIVKRMSAGKSPFELFVTSVDRRFRLEPLLYRIQQNRSAILCPSIDMISDQTMSYTVNLSTELRHVVLHLECVFRAQVVTAWVVLPGRCISPGFLSQIVFVPNRRPALILICTYLT